LRGFFTDGVSEPENPYGEMFGEERLAKMIQRNANLPEEKIIEAVLKSVRDWSGAAEQSDDITLLLARRL
jgi:sigma-B regulation protein RsbU (phosphoserine phosphatase)